MLLVKGFSYSIFIYCTVLSCISIQYYGAVGCTFKLTNECISGYEKDDVERCKCFMFQSKIQ